jgi:hypothetical protein
MADNVAVRARCVACGTGLSFEAWSQGNDRCAACSSKATSETYSYVPGPASAGLNLASPAPDSDEFARLLEDLPDELVEELASALEAAALPESPRQDESAVGGFLAEVGFGSDPREPVWAAWGFSVGFAVNVAVAKLAQMSTSAPMSDLFVPIIAGGLVAGGAGAVIGWGLAKLKES